MRKILLIFIFLILITNGYADLSSSLFQNSFNSDMNAAPSTSPTNSNKEQFLNKTVAIVNNHPITSLELEQEVEKLKATNPNAQQFGSDPLTIKREALQDLISQSVLYQLAQQNNINISQQQLDASIKDIAARNGVSVESLKLNIEASGMSFDSYKARIRKQLMVNQLQQQAISQQVYVSPEEIQRYIKKHQKEFDKEMSPIKTYSISNLIVVLPSSKKAQQKKIDQFKKLAIAVNKGYINFTDLAEQFSQAPNASSGGLVGDSISFNSIPDIYKKEAKKLKSHQASEPFILNHTIQMIYINNINEKAPLLSKIVTKYYVYAIEIKLDGAMTEQSAKSTLERATLAIKSGQSFTKVAEKFNQDYGHANGRFGWVSPLDSPPSLPPAAFARLEQLKKGELSEPFQADAKTWMIMKYTRTKRHDAAEELKQQKALEAIFSEKAQEIYKTWITSMKDDAYIEVLENDLKTPDLY